MRVSIMWLGLLATPALAAEDPAIVAVRAQDDALQAAHGRGDLATYRAALSRHYVYVDIGGERVTGDRLAARREDDQRRVLSSDSSEDEAVRLADNAVMLRGVEHSLASYYGGLPRLGHTRWTALWMREDDGVWRLTAETATPVRTDDRLPYLLAPQPSAVLAAHAGDWTLATATPMVLQLRVDGDALVAGLAGQAVRWTFRPASAMQFFADERPFELRFAASGDTLELVTWGTATQARRVANATTGRDGD